MESKRGKLNSNHFISKRRLFAELLNAASGSIDALNKVYTSIEKNKTSKEIKTMDIQSKERMNTQDNMTTLLSRQEVLEALAKRDDVIDLVDQP